jgi:hypothetical protein
MSTSSLFTWWAPNQASKALRQISIFVPTRTAGSGSTGRCIHSRSVLSDTHTYRRIALRSIQSGCSLVCSSLLIGKEFVSASCYTTGSTPPTTSFGRARLVRAEATRLSPSNQPRSGEEPRTFSGRARTLFPRMFRHLPRFRLQIAQPLYLDFPATPVFLFRDAVGRALSPA